ncbi:DUF1456 family protein [Vibrio palustris]|uniref:DUF1456 family protein n=1 Tax=Vibrio palustris TaxID=1918946 RepID=A0A1R4B0S6_9VIBR|nr:DUF1456 family protein [Vibrio palustris]SJL82511.1 hypothetical protein VPAL9027_00440 [Vibrio palustris]
MNNNDIFRLITSAFNLKDTSIAKTFASTDMKVTTVDIATWLSEETDNAETTLTDVQLASFLNGLINMKRGKREGEQPKPETELNNNMILQKLRIALNLKAEDMLNTFEFVGVEFNKHELGAFFRKPGNKHYRPCPDAVLRDFLMAVEAQREASLG